MDEIDVMFSHLLNEMDDLTQSLAQSVDTDTGLSDLNESMNDLDNHDLDISVPDPNTPALKTLPTGDQTSPPAVPPPAPPTTPLVTETEATVNQPPASEPTALQTVNNEKSQKLILKVLMADGGSKSLMVEKRQTVRDVLDKLFEKTYCDCAIDWSLCETNSELHTELMIEDHEFLSEALSAWTNNTKNKVYFLQKPQKYVMFTQPQFFYMWKKSYLKAVSEQAKQLLLKENFESSTVKVPDLEGWLYLKEDGKKMWKPRFFVLRASGLYYVPKGKTKSSSDLACFVRFEQVNIYTTASGRLRYKAPTDYCFILKHPCIQKESQYVKFLCCEDEDAILLWVNSIRIAKYGTALYENFKVAVTRALHPPNVLATDADSSNCPILDEDTVEEPPDFIPPPPPGHMAIL